MKKNPTFQAETNISTHMKENIHTCYQEPILFPSFFRYVD